MNGNRTHAARLLGISLRTLRNKLRDYREAGRDAVRDPAAASADGQILPRWRASQPGRLVDGFAAVPPPSRRQIATLGTLSHLVPRNAKEPGTA